MSTNHTNSLALSSLSDLEDDELLFRELKGTRIIDDSITMEDFCWIATILECAFDDDVTTETLGRFRDILENLMSQLGVFPIEEGELPEMEAVTL